MKYSWFIFILGLLFACGTKRHTMERLDITQLDKIHFDLFDTLLVMPPNLFTSWPVSSLENEGVSGSPVYNPKKVHTPKIFVRHAVLDGSKQSAKEATKEQSQVSAKTTTPDDGDYIITFVLLILLLFVLDIIVRLKVNKQ